MKKLFVLITLLLGIFGLASISTYSQEVADLPSIHSIEEMPQTPSFELADLPSIHSIELHDDLS
ncbi:hypothetical protein [Bacillus sp. S/N-304-OC-R1]|uniref:hypothetical protein n=1 Tax=Bacillus sp. S/N-304-OC-R1 TaxID=2758034 RepID=UPI001C8E202C|nr:hypothetical protein [Bacillus sp. S/N-304-OC-R1]MBY0124114.1 hypothetical protein [Bacillus sp. S/N-304-OC-R1]